MIIWVDAQLSPSIAGWIIQNFPVEAFALREIGLRDADDIEIFNAARQANAIVLTKDKDFVDLIDRYGPPPKIIWLTCGNTSNIRLRQILDQRLADALSILEIDSLVEIG